MNTVFVNGQAQNTVSALDRGLLYGDSIFETLAVVAQQPLMLEDHLKRLKEGSDRLYFNADIEALNQELQNVLIHCPLNGKSILRITLTRGEQSRGYRPGDDSNFTSILSIHKWPEYPESLHTKGMKLNQSDFRYAQQPRLAGIKHSNRLEQVLAAHSIGPGFDDVVILDTGDNVISTSKGNIFFQFGHEWLTPDLSQCGIEGVVRANLIKHFMKEGIPCGIKTIKLNELLARQAEITAALCCNSIMGIVPIKHIFSKSINSTKSCQILRDKLVKAKVIAT